VITFPLRKPARLEELFDGGEIRVADGTCRIPHEFGATKLTLLADQESFRS